MDRFDKHQNLSSVSFSSFTSILSHPPHHFFTINLPKAGPVSLPPPGAGVPGQRPVAQAPRAGAGDHRAAAGEGGPRGGATMDGHPAAPAALSRQ